METIDFIINGRGFTADETEGKYSIVSDAKFIGQMYKENNGWSWESASPDTNDQPWPQIAEKIDKHLQNLLKN